MTWLRDAVEGWSWHSSPSIVLGSSGPTRVATHDEPDPEAAPPRPVGFLTTVCDHQLGDLPCVNRQPHQGGGRGCIHIASSGSSVDDRHADGGHG